MPSRPARAALPKRSSSAANSSATSPVALILGDNIFYGAGLIELRPAGRRRTTRGATVFAYAVEDPERYGVVDVRPDTGHATSIEEKPAEPTVELGGDRPLFLRQRRARDRRRTYARRRAASSRSPTSTAPISSAGTCASSRLGRGFAWLDTGTHDSLHDAASYVRTIEQRQGMKIMCLEEIALELGYLTPDEVRAARRPAGQDRICGLSPPPRRRASSVLEIRPLASGRPGRNPAPRFGDERGFFLRSLERGRLAEAGHRRALRPGQSFLLARAACFAGCISSCRRRPRTNWCGCRGVRYSTSQSIFARSPTFGRWAGVDSVRRGMEPVVRAQGLCARLSSTLED